MKKILKVFEDNVDIFKSYYPLCSLKCSDCRLYIDKEQGCVFYTTICKRGTIYKIGISVDEYILMLEEFIDVCSEAKDISCKYWAHCNMRKCSFNNPNYGGCGCISTFEYFLSKNVKSWRE